LAAKFDAQRAKLDALEKRLGIEHGQTSKSGEASVEVLSGKKHRFDDTEYLEQSRELVEGVKSAVSAGLLKKRKKTKTSSPEGDRGKGPIEGKGKGKEKVVEETRSDSTPVVPTAVVDVPAAKPLDAVGA
jgi:hypothetical protein